MTRTSRTRRYPHPVVGYVDNYTNDVYKSTITRTTSHEDVMSDWHGRPVQSSPMTMNKTKGLLIANGGIRSTYANSIASYDFRNWPVAANNGGLTTTPFKAPSGWTLDLVAGTNPNRPVVTPLTVIQDLIDIPRQIRDLGRLITKPKSAMSTKEASNHYLGAQFGWVPLFEDLDKLLNLQSYIHKKNVELQSLYNKGGLRRRLKFQEDHQNAESHEKYPLYGVNNHVYFPFDCSVKRRSWATIRWKPTTVPGVRPSDEALAKKARQIASGLTLRGTLQGAWDLIPWTWLLGWFTNVGKYAYAYANTVPVQHSDMCFMSEAIRTYTAKPHRTVGTSDDTLSYGGAITYTTKTRITSGSVTAGFNMPYLSMFRLSILGALFAQRTMR